MDNNKQNKDNKEENNQKNENEEECEEKEPSTINELLEFNKIKIFTLKDLEIENFIAGGGQAKVYKGKLKEINSSVAIKIMYNIDWTCFFREVEIVSKLKHDNIPQFYGVLLDQKGEKVIIGLVSQYIKGNTLEDTNYFEIDEKLKFAIIKSLAEAFEYVHDQKFIHRDLNLANLIIDENGKVYVIDFGIAKITKKSSNTLTRAKGTVNFSAPETFIVNDYDENDMIISEISNKVDIWSYGCIVSYLYSGIKPWCNKYKDNEAVIQQLLINQTEFPIPDQIKENKSIYEIVQNCTKVYPDQRKSFKEILSFMDIIR